MESLVNEEVRHLKFGKGSIVEEPAEHIKVRFQSGVEKTFLFPEAFEGFLSFEKEELQETYSRLACNARRRKETGRMEAIQKREDERKLEQTELLKHRRSAARTTRAAVKAAKS